ncbi:hypothetical protein PFICI_08085 [Pestalotiopsis fici W106-1]|uniref:GST N-terminal domain-containing protein n=1 Tax=Pestalotiopsis fici (strain W106-1 / CGMCC3.15140) TaxID=1229662 RepID=W3X5U8_PESFW|nr:uncharacterized protein PFICI_08085 [Pestalotiopsis fici W106-1]ETS80556.1 hypothetical protein PFICI_08085 [Pestalotiopsis fici W106-1]
MAPLAQEGYSLFVFPFSLYSIMTRYTFTLGRAGLPQETSSLDINLKLVNLHRDENLAEDYLLNINPKGQVPALTGNDLPTPLTDSLDISYWLCNHFPGLLPEAHKPVIQQFLTQLHGFEGLSLSVPSKADRQEGVPNPSLDALLARSDITPEYKRALEYKKKFHQETQEPALWEENVERAERLAKSVFDRVLRIHSWPQHTSGPWIFGEAATVLDAHLVPLVARLLDCGRTDLVPDELQEYALAAMRGPEYQAVTHGRRTIWDVSLGHVGLMKDF